MSNKPRKLKIMSFHDVHLLHLKMNTERLISKLKNHICDTPEFASLDILMFPGDIFDRLVFLNHEDITIVKRFIRYILKLCKKHNVSIKIVEGTPAHDAKQSVLFVQENETIGADLHYAQSIEVEYDEKLDLHVLYVPDQMGEPVDVYERAKKALNQYHLDRADIVVFHGQFTYQFPAYLNIVSHDTALWEDIVNHYVFAGHVHTRSVSPNGKILVAGSFDRMKHGEEEPKGYLLVTIDTEKGDVVDWIENKESFCFKTIDISGKSVEDALSIIDEIATTVPDDSHIRLFVNKDDTLQSALSSLRVTYPFIYWKIDTKDEKKKEDTKDVTLLPSQFVPIAIHEDNICNLVKSELKDKYPHLTEDEINEILFLLENEM